MTDETKGRPFAVALPAGASVAGGSGSHLPGISIDRGEPWHGPASFGDAENLVNVINGCVEQREARLRDALRGMLALPAGPPWDVPPLNAERTIELDDWNVQRTLAREAAHSALAGTGPDHVRAQLLEAANARLKEAQAAFDLLDKRESLTAEQICKYLEANGWRKPSMEGFSDNDIATEWVRRRRETEPVTVTTDRSDEDRLWDSFRDGDG